MQAPADVWADWLRHGRHGGHPAAARRVQTRVRRYASRVVEGAKLDAGMVLLDVGAGDGLVAFEAIARTGPGLRVILADLSPALLRRAARRAHRRKMAQQCVFIHCAADDLRGVGDASVDAVTTRSVLAYVANKGLALAEFYRVLKPSGRISMAEPLFREEALAVCALKIMLERRTGKVEALAPLLHRWKAAQFPDTLEKMAASPLTNYRAGDLAVFARRAGFAEVAVDTERNASPAGKMPWPAFLASAPHPWAKPLRVILEEQFSAAEQAVFEAYLRPVIEAGSYPMTERMAYLTAVKPGL